jgi:hypothetical protein
MTCCKAPGVAVVSIAHLRWLDDQTGQLSLVQGRSTPQTTCTPCLTLQLVHWVPADPAAEAGAPADAAAWWRHGIVQLLHRADHLASDISDLLGKLLLRVQAGMWSGMAKQLSDAANAEAWLDAGLVPALAAFAGTHDLSCMHRLACILSACDVVIIMLL